MSLKRKDDYDYRAWMKRKDPTPVKATFLTALT